MTAQKRAENIQDVPLSIMADFEKSRWRRRAFRDVTGLERLVPNLRASDRHRPCRRPSRIRIRGFGARLNAAIDPSVAPYIDGVYIPRPGAILSSFLDVEGVEVLRGPQGTLFGRNATVGAVSLHTYAPSTSGFSARVAAQAANYGSYQGEGMVNVRHPATSRSVAPALANTTDGFVKNKLDGQTYGANAPQRAASRRSGCPPMT